MFEVDHYRPDVFFVPVLIFLVVVVGGLILFTLLNRHLYELRLGNLARERMYVEGAARRLEEIEDPEEARRLLERTLNGLRRPNMVVLFNLINVMAEPKRSLYIDRVFAERGKESLSGLFGQALSARRKWRRIEAVEILGRFKRGEAVETLVRCLEDDVVYAAVQALITKRDLAAAEALLGLLGTDRVNDKRLVAMLEYFPLPIHTLLWPRLEDPDPRIRTWAATLLEVSGEDGTVTRLVGAARDPDADVRSAAIKSLANIGDVRAEELLPETLDDEAWFVRAGAARLAGSLKATRFSGRVIGLLRDETWWVRQNAKTALIALCPDIEEELVRYLVAEDRFVRNMVAEVLEASGAVERSAAELEENPRSPEARRFFEALIVAEGRGSVEGLAARANPKLRRILDGILDASAAVEA